MVPVAVVGLSSGQEAVADGVLFGSLLDSGTYS